MLILNDIFKTNAYVLKEKGNSALCKCNISLIISVELLILIVYLHQFGSKDELCLGRKILGLRSISSVTNVEKFSLMTNFSRIT